MLGRPFAWTAGKTLFGWFQRACGMSEAEFRDFVFANPIRMWTKLNPDFFKGTVVEGEVAKFRQEAKR